MMSFHVVESDKLHPSTALFRERAPKRSTRHQFDLYGVGLWVVWVVLLVVGYLLFREIV